MTQELTQAGEAPVAPRRSKRGVIALGAVGVASAVAGLTAGAGMFASAATTSIPLVSDESVCANPPVAPPATPLYVKKFVAGAGKVSGTIPAPTTAQLTALGITPTLVNVVVQTSYNSGRSGANKIDVVTVNLPGHQYNNPVLFNIPPVVNSINVGNGTVAYAAQTTGKAFANVVVSEVVVQATSLTPEVVAGTACPAGTTKIGAAQGNTTAKPGTPTNVTATPGGSGDLTNDTAPNNGAVTVKFTPPATNGVQISDFVILPIDLTAPNTTQYPRYVGASTDNTSTTPISYSVSGLNTSHSYQFQVLAQSNFQVLGSPSAATTPAVTPTVETQAQSGATAQLKPAQRNSIK